jgi:iron complex transport system substrate-binding protein
LLPSATEIVCALGLRNALVGVSHECDHPASVDTLPKVTRTLIPPGLASADIDQLVRRQLAHTKALYSLDMDLLRRLEPDLIVTQALCDVCAVAADEVESAACQLPGRPRVLNLEPMCLEEVFATLLLVGEAAGVEDVAARVVAGLRARVARVASRVPAGPRPRVAFLEWLDPPFNGGHWTPELIHAAGGHDCFAGRGRASRTLAWDEVTGAQPDILFIALCGFDTERSLRDLPALTRRPGWGDLPCVRTGQVWLADGNQYFSRPGPRLVESLEMLAAVLHPEYQSPPDVSGRAIRLDAVTLGLL